MNNSRIWNTLRLFSPKEWEALNKFLESPYHNHRKDVLQLFLFLRQQSLTVKNRTLGAEHVFNAVYPGKPFDPKALRYLSSSLNQLTQAFLIDQEFKEDAIAASLLLSRAYRRIGDTRSLRIETKKNQKQIEIQPLRNHQYHQWLYGNLSEDYSKTVLQSRSEAGQLARLDEELNILFFSQKLRHACSSLTHKQVSEYEFQQDMLPDILNQVEKRGYLKYPAVAAYYYGYRALTNLAEPVWFEGLKDSIIRFKGLFPHDEWRNLYLLAINYCIGQLNAGKSAYLAKVFEIYQRGLEEDVFLEQGKLSRFTYNNITTAALGLGELDWAFQFIHQFAPLIEPTYQRQTFSYNLAVYYYQIQDYEKALLELRAMVTDDVLHGLDVRRMMVRIFYERKEIQALLSLLDSFRAYLYRKRGLGYHKTHYLNFLRFVRKLMEPDLQQEEKRLELIQQIQAVSALADRQWLLQQLQK
ncbi:MAG: hypothetical protein KDC34_03650 [Saprospiraceae bacterium]|nr:hypothetical protein [Saprospiraceae bacterium]